MTVFGFPLSAQFREQIVLEEIAKAEQYAVDLIAREKELPERWAAMQRRQIVNAADLEKLQMTRSWEEEVWGHSEQDSKTYGRLRLEVGPSENPFDGVVRATIADGKTSFAFGNQPWQTPPTIPRRRLPTRPFSWCYGFPNFNAKWRIVWRELLAELVHEKRSELSSMQVARKTEDCILTGGGKTMRTARTPNKVGLFVYKVEFSAAEKLPVRYSLLQMKKEVSKKAIEAGEFTIQVQGIVQWKRFQVGEKDGEPLYLPVRTEVQSSVNKGQDLECVNEIVWIFGRSVPDSMFLKPDDPKFAEPVFPKPESSE